MKGFEEMMPENPLGMSPSLAIDEMMKSNEPNWEGLKGEDGKMDPLKAGMYAWAIYGVIAIVNSSYYLDRFYNDYSMSNYGRTHFAFRTWHGTGTYLRNFSKMVMWGTAGLSWVLTFLPMPFFSMIFGYVVTGLIMVESLRVMLQVLMSVFAFFADYWDHEYFYLQYYGMDVAGFGAFSDW